MLVDIGVVNKVYGRSNKPHDEIDNHIIVNKCDGSIQYVTNFEYNLLSRDISHANAEYYSKSNALATLSQSGEFVIFANAMFKVLISYSKTDSIDYCALSIKILRPDIIRFADTLNNYDKDNLIIWGCRSETGVKMEIPAMYCDYLMSNDFVRLKELNKLMSCTKFDYLDASGKWTSMVGLNQGL